MRIVTSQCDRCGSIVAGNVLERYHRVDCPGADCDCVHEFENLPEADRSFLRENSEQYRMD